MRKATARNTTKSRKTQPPVADLVTVKKPKKAFDELAFADAAATAMKAAMSIVKCAKGYAYHLDEESIGEALGIAADHLDRLDDLFSEWNELSRQPRGLEDRRLEAAQAEKDREATVWTADQIDRMEKLCAEQRAKLKVATKRGRK